MLLNMSHTTEPPGADHIEPAVAARKSTATPMTDALKLSTSGDLRVHRTSRIYEYTFVRAGRLSHNPDLH